MNGPTNADVARWLDELESDDPAYRMEALGKWAEGWRARALKAEAELVKVETILVAADRVREAYEAMLDGRKLGRLPDFERLP